MFRWDEETNSHTNNVHHLRSPSADHSRQCAVTSLSLCPCHNKQTASIAKFNTIKEGASPHQRTHQAAPISGWHLAEESKLQDHKHRVSVLHACLFTSYILAGTKLYWLVTERVLEASITAGSSLDGSHITLHQHAKLTPT